MDILKPLIWKLYVDGAANQKGSGIGILMVSLDVIVIEKSLRLGFSATNNEDEYKTFLIGVSMVKKMGGKVVKVFLDSRLTVGQVMGEMEARDHRMQRYLDKAGHLQFGFESFSIQQVPKSQNVHADSLATLATSSRQSLPRVIFVEDLLMPTKVKVMTVGVH